MSKTVKDSALDIVGMTRLAIREVEFSLDPVEAGSDAFDGVKFRAVQRLYADPGPDQELRESLHRELLTLGRMTGTEDKEEPKAGVMETIAEYKRHELDNQERWALCGRFVANLIKVSAKKEDAAFDFPTGRQPLFDSNLPSRFLEVVLETAMREPTVPKAS